MALCFQNSRPLLNVAQEAVKYTEEGNKRIFLMQETFNVYPQCGHACVCSSCRAVRLEESYGDFPAKAETAEMVEITGMCCACSC